MKVQFKGDYITNPVTNERKDIVTETDYPVNPKDLIIGGLLVLGGIYCMVRSAFTNGAYNYSKAEMNVLRDLDLAHPADDNDPNYYFIDDTMV